MEQGPEDRVGEAIVVALSNLGGEVDGRAGEVGLELLGDELSVDLGDVKACTVRLDQYDCGLMEL